MPEPRRQAFLDANVLRGNLQTDVLLSLADNDAFAPRWSAQVLDEVHRNRPDGLSAGKMQRRLDQMNRAFPRAMVSGYEHLEPQMQADEKDKHVLAAAVHSESTVLVTENVKDFHPPTTGPHAMPVQKLSPFLSQVVDDNPQRAVAAMRQMISRTDREPNTMPALIDKLAAQQDLRGFAQKLNSVVPAEERGSHPTLEQGKSAQSVAFDGVASAAGAAQKPESTPTASKHGAQEQSKSNENKL
ncbi:PIN domain-containing protein [Kribbella shirazensis]|uniref:Putative nucleic acid-binding protein n=1 Tax=Kribbella shirazensis TaxID=1105143 RepID=A0A7X5V6V7_9ACTN|nr:PIN domain-containing protein [Kribbella shirazensis]NIK55705.1 putative nucleic acid-binding protein [Kribbella shirazensis]